MDLSRRNFMKGAVSTGILASLAGCAAPPSGSGLQGLDQDQQSLLTDSKWLSANANIGNTRVDDTGDPRAGISVTNYSEGIARSVDNASGDVYEPVVDGRGNVFIAGPDEAIHCHDFESGQEKWSVGLPAHPAGSPSFDEVESGFSSNETLYITTTDGHLVGISPGAGEAVFESEIGSSCSAGPTAIGGACYAYTDDPSKLVAVEESGEIAWEVGEFSDSPTHPPALGDDLIYVQTDRGVIGVAPDSQVDDPKVAVVISDTARSPPTVLDETVYFAGARGGIHAYEIDVPDTAFNLFGDGLDGVDEVGENGDAPSKEHLFRAELQAPSTGSIAVDSQHVYSVLDNGRIEAVSRRDGEFAWRTSPNSDDEFRSVSVSGTVLYATATNGGLYIISTINGDVLNRYSIDSPFASDISIVEDAVLATTEDEIEGVEARDGPGGNDSPNETDEGSDSDSDGAWAEGEALEQIVSMQTELTADPLQPRFEEGVARGQAIDYLSASEGATWTSPLRAGELAEHAVNRFETGVEEGEVTITDADAAVQKMMGSMAVTGEFMLTFSNESHWPTPDHVDGMEVAPDNGLPINTARNEGVGFEICRSITVLPVQLFMAFGGGLLLRGAKRFTRGARGRFSDKIEDAANALIRKIKEQRSIEKLKSTLGLNTPIGVWVVHKVKAVATMFRKFITEGHDSVVRYLENTSRLQEAERKFFIDNFTGRSAARKFMTNTTQAHLTHYTDEYTGDFVADYTGIDVFAGEVYDIFAEFLNSRLQSVIESDGLPVDVEDNVEDTGFIDRRVQDYIQDMTNEERYEEASRGDVETDQFVMQDVLADAVRDFEQTAIIYSDLRDAVDNWDSVMGLPEDIVDATQALYSADGTWDTAKNAVDWLLSAGWSYIKGFLEWIEGAVEIGFGAAAVYDLLRSHGNGVSKLQGL